MEEVRCPECGGQGDPNDCANYCRDCNNKIADYVIETEIKPAYEWMKDNLWR